MFFFIADTHFGHGAIIDLCHRPFKCVEEMDSIMIERWNKKVSPNDTVYIVGDLFYKHKNPEKILKQLKGKKRLVVGNHDAGWLKEVDASHHSLSVDHLIEISDGKHKLVLCHYPVMCWKHELKSYMIHGHIHNNTNAPYWSVIRNNPRLLNAGTDINSFELESFDEMLANNESFKTGAPDGNDRLYRIKEVQK